MATKKETKSSEKLQASVAEIPVKIETNFESGLITSELIKVIRPSVGRIQTLLKSQIRTTLRIADELAALQAQFHSFAVKKKSTKEEADAAFSEFVEQVFNLKASRAKEYVRVANKELVRSLQLPISHLCELARVPDESLKELLEDNSEEKLLELNFRSVQALANEYNDNARNKKETAATSSSPKSTEASKEDRDSSSSQQIAVGDVASERELSILFEKETAESLKEQESYGSNLVGNTTMATARLRSAFENFSEAFRGTPLTFEAKTLMAEISDWKDQQEKLNRKKG